MKIWLALAAISGLVWTGSAQAQEALQIPNDVTTGTVIGKLAKLTTANPAAAIITATTDIDNIVGIVTGTTGSGGTTGNALVSVLGAPNCIFDATTVVSGDYVVNSPTVAGACHDAGSTRPTSTQVIGRASANGGGGSTIAVYMEKNFTNAAGSGSPGGSSGDLQTNNGAGAFGAAHMNDNGSIIKATESIDVTTNGYIYEITNDGSTGTSANLLAKLNTSGQAIKAATTDTDNMVGICIGNCTTSGSAQIAISGRAACQFDSSAAVTTGHYVGISSTVAGNCADVGTSRPTGSQTIGRALTGGSAGTVQTVGIYLGTTNTAGGGSGTVNAGTGGQLAYYATSTNAVSGNSNANISSGQLTMGTAGATVGSVCFANATSGTICLQPATGALGSSVVTFPINTGTAAELNLSQSWTAGQAVTPTSASPCGTQSAGGTMTVDFSTANECNATFGAGNLTIANPSNVKAGQAYVFQLTQDATGSRTVTWGANFKWAGGTAPTLSTAANAVDVISCVATSTNFLACTLAVKGAA